MCQMQKFFMTASKLTIEKKIEPQSRRALMKAPLSRKEQEKLTTEAQRLKESSKEALVFPYKLFLY